jgi:hypothetical protein
MVTETMKSFNVTIRTQIQANNIDEAMDKVAEFTWRIPKPKKVDISEADKISESVSLDEK